MKRVGDLIFCMFTYAGHMNIHAKNQHPLFLHLAGINFFHIFKIFFIWDWGTSFKFTIFSWDIDITLGYIHAKNQAIEHVYLASDDD